MSKSLFVGLGFPWNYIPIREPTLSQQFLLRCVESLGISKTRTTAYNPKSDGMVERFNKTLINIVAMMIEPKRQQSDWDECLPYASFAYRCTPQESTGESPNMMVLGREVRLPVDLVVECPTVEDRVRTDFAEALRHNLQEAYPSEGGASGGVPDGRSEIMTGRCMVKG